MRRSRRQRLAACAALVVLAAGGAGAAHGFAYHGVRMSSTTSPTGSTDTTTTDTTPDPPAAPAGLTANATGAAEIRLAWGSVQGATSYRVLRGSSAGGPFTQVATTADTAAIDGGLTIGTTYFYVVEADDGTNVSPDSDVASATASLATPAGVTAGATGAAEVSVSWAAVDGAADYRVLRATASDGPYTAIGSSHDASYLDTGLTVGTTYFYEVEVVSGNVTSDASTPASATASLAVPSGPVATATGADEISLTWDAVDGATTYRVLRATSSEGPYSQVATSGEASYLDAGLRFGATYFYEVEVVSGESTSAPSASVSATASVAAPAELIARATGAAEVALSWQVVPGAASYVVLRSGESANGPFAQVAAGTGTTTLDTGLTPGRTYYYEVEASDGTNVSAPSGVASVAASLAVPTGLAAAATGGGGISLTWDAVDGATAYDVLRATAGAGPYSSIGTSDTSSFVDTGLTPGTTYFYEVEVADGELSSDASEPVSATATTPAITDLVATSNGTTAIDLSWSDVEDATGYRVLRSTSQNGPFTELGPSDGTSFADTGLNPATLYYYVVRAVAGTATSADSNVASARTDAADPHAVVDNAGCTENTLGANDDGSTGAVDIGFSVNFFGQTYSRLYVNNNGNVTFGEPMGEFTPFTLQPDGGIVIIAPFFADVDTRGSGSAPVRYGYGQTVFAGHPAFCVDWVNVGYYGGHSDKLNSFQLLLVDRSDSGTGNFDIVFDYDNVRWETGDASGGLNGLGGTSAHVGYSNGVDTAFELPGSGVNGALLDSSRTGLISGSRNTSQLGRYIFPVRGGAPPPSSSSTADLDVSVTDPGGASVSGAHVVACASSCVDADAGEGADAGHYFFNGLQPGDYSVQVDPAGNGLLRATKAVTVAAGDDLAVSMSVAQANRPDAGGPPSQITVHDCAGGVLDYQLVRGETTVATGTALDSGNGTYVIDVSGIVFGRQSLRISSQTHCAEGTNDQTTDVFADPSGTVVDDAAGQAALPGATVTLLDSNGNAIAAGDSRLSGATPDNPETTAADGSWGWDVAPGTYTVLAEESGCGSTVSGPLTIVPGGEVSGVVLHLSCGGSPPAPSGGLPTLPSLPPAAPPANVPPPVHGVDVDVAPVAGTILVNGQPLAAGEQIPFGSTVDARDGIVALSTQNADGTIQTSYFFGGVFTVVLAPDGETELDLEDADFGATCASTRTTSATQLGRSAQSGKTVVASLWGSGTGHFRTKGRYSAATVRGTVWNTVDRCDGTLTEVLQGVVQVMNLQTGATIDVPAGHSYLVKP